MWRRVSKQLCPCPAMKSGAGGLDGTADAVASCFYTIETVKTKTKNAELETLANE